MLIKGIFCQIYALINLFRFVPYDFIHAVCQFMSLSADETRVSVSPALGVFGDSMISGKKTQLIFLFENSTHPLHPRAVKSCYIAFDRNVPRVGLDIDCVGGAGGAGWKVPLPLCPCPVRGIILILYLCECISVSCRPCPCPGTVFSLLMSDVCWSCWILI